MMKTKTSKIIFQFAVGAVMFASGAGLTLLLTRGDSVFAEQAGSSPDSGEDSHIKELYDDLVSENKGEETAGAWGDWGSNWNRIYSSTEYTPVDYSLQSLATYDDYFGTYKDEEAEWVEIDGSPFAGYADLGLATGTVKRDERTGLLWTAESSAYITNVFNLVGDGLRPTGGNAIAFCDLLNAAEYGGVNSWYLPTQKELLQAYIDGIYSKDNVFGTEEYFWSSSEVSDGPTYAWGVNLYYGYTNLDYKTLAYAVRCVAQD